VWGGDNSCVMAAAPVCTSSHCSVHHYAPKLQKILYSYVDDYVRSSSKDSEYFCSEYIKVHFVTNGLAHWVQIVPQGRSLFHV